MLILLKIDSISLIREQPYKLIYFEQAHGILNIWMFLKYTYLNALDFDVKVAMK